MKMAFIQYMKIEFKDGFAYKDLCKLEGVEVLEASGSLMDLLELLKQHKKEVGGKYGRTIKG